MASVKPEREEADAVNVLYKADELEEAFGQAMADCMKNNEPPVDFVLHKYTKISQDTMTNYLKWAEEMEKGKREVDIEVIRSAEVIKKWQEFKTVFWVRKGLDDPKLAAFAIFNLKQPCNGGYSDKPVGAVGNIEVVVKADGVGDKAFG